MAGLDQRRVCAHRLSFYGEGTNADVTLSGVRVTARSRICWRWRPRTRPSRQRGVNQPAMGTPRAKLRRSVRQGVFRVRFKQSWGYVSTDDQVAANCDTSDLATMRHISRTLYGQGKTIQDYAATFAADPKVADSLLVRTAQSAGGADALLVDGSASHCIHWSWRRHHALSGRQVPSYLCRKPK